MKNIVNLKNRWKSKESTTNAWLSLNSSFVAEVISLCGFDSITIDMQHGISSYSNLISILQASKIPTFVRVPSLDQSHIQKVLDAGANGIIVPMINTEEDAKNLIKNSYYPPHGERSFGPIRAKFEIPNYYENYSDNILIIAMIETKIAISNIDSILQYEGIHGIYIGPADLSCSFNKTPKFDQEDEEVLKAINFILSKSKEYEKFAGIHNATPSYARKMSNLGFDFVTIGSELSFMQNGALNAIEEFKKIK